MSHYNIAAGTASATIEIEIYAADGTDKTGVAYNTAGLSLSYRRDNGALVAITLASLASASSAWSSSGFVAVSGARYRLDLPAAATTTGASNLTVYGSLSGAVIPATTINLDNVPANVKSVSDSTAAATGLNALGFDYNANGRVKATDTQGNALQTALPAMTAFWSQAVTGTATAGAAGSITLAASSSATNGYYNSWWILLTGGTGAGQIRQVYGYTGSTKAVVPSSNWLVNPDATTVYVLIPQSAIDLGSWRQSQPATLNSGYVQADSRMFAGQSAVTNVLAYLYASGAANTTSQSGHTSTTLVLASNASATDNAYRDWLLVVGGQLRVVTAYNGTTKVATVSPAWSPTPGTGAIYTLVPAAANNVTAIASQPVSAAAPVAFPASVGTSTFDPATTNVKATDPSGNSLAKPGDAMTLVSAYDAAKTAQTALAGLTALWGLCITGTTTATATSTTINLAVAATKSLTGWWVMTSTGQLRQVVYSFAGSKILEVYPAWDSTPPIGTGYTVIPQAAMGLGLWRNRTPDVLSTNGSVPANLTQWKSGVPADLYGDQLRVRASLEDGAISSATIADGALDNKGNWHHNDQVVPALVHSLLYQSVDEGGGHTIESIDGSYLGTFLLAMLYGQQSYGMAYNGFVADVTATLAGVNVTGIDGVQPGLWFNAYFDENTPPVNVRWIRDDADAGDGLAALGLAMKTNGRVPADVQAGDGGFDAADRQTLTELVAAVGQIQPAVDPPGGVTQTLVVTTADTGDEIQGAIVRYANAGVTRDVAATDADGVAVIVVLPGSFTRTIVADGFQAKADAVNVVAEAAVTIALSRIEAQTGIATNASPGLAQ